MEYNSSYTEYDLDKPARSTDTVVIELVSYFCSRLTFTQRVSHRSIVLVRTEFLDFGATFDLDRIFSFFFHI